MSLSARRIGRILGLTAEEVNYLLKREGFLEGEPSNYSPTNKGKAYCTLKVDGNGYGGYAARSWEWAEWDESILDHLSITDEEKIKIRTAVAEQRRIRRKNKEKEGEEYWNKVKNQNSNEVKNNSSDFSLGKNKLFIGSALAATLIGCLIKYFKE